MKGTFNVLEACVSNQVRKLIYSSSASVYGNALSEPITEDHPFNNNTFYGATKIAGEQMCRSFHHRFGLDYTGLRYMNVYGPRQDYRGAYIAVIMKILDRLDRGKSPVIYGDGSQAYDFINVKDCARANICAMKAKVSDSFYNVGTGIKTSIKDLAEMLIQITGSDVDLEYDTTGHTFVENRIGCTRHAKKDLNFSAEIQLQEGLRGLIEWRKSHIETISKE
jgi:UDP-glucose 4-epimerase